VAAVFDADGRDVFDSARDRFAGNAKAISPRTMNVAGMGLIVMLVSNHQRSQ